MDRSNEIFQIQNLEQLRAIADPLRHRLMELIFHQAMTATQIAAQLGEAPAKIHYHVRELERVGLVNLVETREKSGILEKYYRMVAPNLSIPQSLLQSAPVDDTIAATQSFLDNVIVDALQSMRHVVETPGTPMRLSRELAFMTREEFRDFSATLEALLDHYAQPRGLDGEEQWTLDLILHLSTPAQIVAAQSLAAPNLPVKPDRKVFAIGVMNLTRTMLENALANDQHYDITVFGICIVDGDVTPELLTATVKRARISGTIQATEPLRAALKSLRQETPSK